ncbi:hypothetical protein SeKA_D0106 (plasmid) [Salmonella enterica subsp. enterica serovar Kentucky str. CVM29188]|nr:hypothetical protein SeKA_D0106 [Salmonella enterica subsp. enterica serovar Kentucky str. CVM29188]ESD79224.1 hypothetical protein HMPREF1609_00470 [Escherichia coli 908541]UMW92553.1 hypothetical protein [Escherichia coli]UMW93615.1 hypothetical protein [Escherichia coli]
MITAVWKCRGVSTNHNHCEINITGHFIMNKIYSLKYCHITNTMKVMLPTY